MSEKREIKVIKKAENPVLKERSIEVAHMYVLIDRHHEKAATHLMQNHWATLRQMVKKVFAKTQDTVV